MRGPRLTANWNSSESYCFPSRETIWMKQWCEMPYVIMSFYIVQRDKSDDTRYSYYTTQFGKAPVCNADWSLSTSHYFYCRRYMVSSLTVTLNTSRNFLHIVTFAY
jgi:predicted membrane-bound dolichyl-phosphate-mannose-protein mannosyltransferase